MFDMYFKVTLPVNYYIKMFDTQFKVRLPVNHYALLN